MRSIPVSWASLLLFLSLPASAATAPPAAPAFAERIDVRAVDIEAVVTDHKGRRVKDLKAEDFRLLVDGREERIDSFSEVREGQTEPTAPAIPAIPPTSAIRVGVGGTGRYELPGFRRRGLGPQE